jgi:hypothetical protein
MILNKAPILASANKFTHKNTFLNAPCGQGCEKKIGEGGRISFEFVMIVNIIPASGSSSTLFF